jgi:hypothetical protein
MEHLFLYGPLPSSAGPKHNAAQGVPRCASGGEHDIILSLDPLPQSQIAREQVLHYKPQHMPFGLAVGNPLVLVELELPRRGHAIRADAQPVRFVFASTSSALAYASTRVGSSNTSVSGRGAALAVWNTRSPPRP